MNNNSNNSNEDSNNEVIIDEPFAENFVDEGFVPSSSRSSLRKARRDEPTPSSSASASSRRKQRKTRSSVRPNRKNNNSSTMTESASASASASAVEDVELNVTLNVQEQQEEALTRVLAGQLRREWLSKEIENESLQRRMRDFHFAQQKRLEKYGHTRPWGILGLYEHLSAIRNDLEWAEDAAWRRENTEPYLSWNDFDDSRDTGFNKPFFTYILLFICTITLIASIGLNGWKVEPLSVNPMIGPSAETLILMGAKDTNLIVAEHQWYRLFTPMFLHAGVIHYLLNMLALWFIGKAVEMCHGFIAALLLFVIPAVGGTILSALFLPAYISVGASGGIFGLIGACLADIVANWSLIFSKQVNSEDASTFGRHVRIFTWLMVDIFINCIIGLTPFVDNFTHLGGMVYGFLCGLSTLGRLNKEFFGLDIGFCGRLRQFLVRFLGVIISFTAIFVTMALLLESDGVTSSCPACRYVSCVPFPFWKTDKWWYCDDCGTVTADARRGSSNFFDQLSLTCPDGYLIDIDLSGQQISDTTMIAKDLPDYCRLY